MVQLAAASMRALRNGFSAHGWKLGRCLLSALDKDQSSLRDAAAKAKRGHCEDDMICLVSAVQLNRTDIPTYVPYEYE